MITEVEVRAEIEAVIFSDIGFPMEEYTKMQPIIDGLVSVVMFYCNVTAGITAREIKHGISKTLEGVVHRAVEDYTIVKPSIVQPTEPFPSLEKKTSLDELMDIDI